MLVIKPSNDDACPSGKGTRARTLLKVIAAFAFVFFAAANTLAQPQNFGMQMHVINIGQGEAILLEFRNHAVLVDTGSEETDDAERYNDFLTNYLDAFFQRRDDLDRTLYGVVLSHPHVDHGRNLMTVLENYNVETFIEGGARGKEQEVKKAIANTKAWLKSNNRRRIVLTNNKLTNKNLTDANLTAWTKDISDRSNAEVRFLSGRRYCSNENNDSLVMRVQFGQKSFLLVGDWETEDEAPNNCGGLIRYLTNKYKNKDDLDVDVYKVGHHGSYNGTNDAILAKMSPDYAVISAGKFEDKTPGGFHAFQFAHPRGHPGDNTTRDSLLKIIAATKKTRPATEVYYLDKVPKKKKIKGVMKTVSVTKRTDFTLTKAVYCTCWDDNIIFTVNTAGDDISVGTKPSN
ncbi:MAG: MBL fold metallo-hydrolase [Pyrinomonadaceae bacterium]